MHPTAKARLGDDHHNGAGGEAKSEHAWPDVLRRTDSPVTGGSPPRPNPSGREGPFGGLRSRVIPDAVPSPRHLACPSVWVGTPTASRLDPPPSSPVGGGTDAAHPREPEPPSPANRPSASARIGVYIWIAVC